MENAWSIAWGGSWGSSWGNGTPIEVDEDPPIVEEWIVPQRKKKLSVVEDEAVLFAVLL